MRRSGPAVLAAIGIGGNLGDRRANLGRALRALRSVPGVRALALSRFRETEPVGGPPGQPRFLNAVLLIECALGPRELLAVLQEIERRHGRERSAELRNGPRTVDLDLLLFGELALHEPGLALPHPRMEGRRFVLEPLAELAPELVLPGSGRTVRAALALLGTEAAR